MRTRVRTAPNNVVIAAVTTHHVETRCWWHGTSLKMYWHECSRCSRIRERWRLASLGLRPPVGHKPTAGLTDHTARHIEGTAVEPHRSSSSILRRIVGRRGTDIAQVRTLDVQSQVEVVSTNQRAFVLIHWILASPELTTWGGSATARSSAAPITILRRHIHGAPSSSFRSLGAM